MDDRVLVVLWVTSRCNLKCKYCYASAAKEQVDMSFETARAVIDYFKNKSMKIQFAGGEPLLNFNLIKEIYDYIKKKGYKASFQMQTNGTLIDYDIAKDIAGMNISLGVSMDGSPDINEFLRGKTNQVVQGIRYLARAGITTNLNCVVSSYNINRLSEMADLALYFGNISAIGLDLLRNTGRAKENIESLGTVTSRDLEKSVRELHSRCELLYALSGKKIRIRSIEEAKIKLQNNSCVCSKEYCYAGCGKSFVVIPNGDFYPCGSVINYPEFYMGNIYKDKSIKKIALQTQKAGECYKCKYSSYCSGGCPSRLIVNKNNNVSETLDCTLRKVSFEIAKGLV